MTVLLQEQWILENSSKSEDTEYRSIAATTSLSQDPQLCAPLILPPAVGWTMTLVSPFEMVSCDSRIISTKDQSHGGLYSLLRCNRSTIVLFCMFIGFIETSWLKGETAFIHRIEWSNASPSDINGGLNKRYVLILKPCSRSLSTAYLNLLILNKFFKLNIIT